MQLGGLLFRIDSSRYLVTSFAIISASEVFLGVRVKEMETLQDACEKLRALLLRGNDGPRPVTLPAATCFQIDNTSEVRLQLAYEFIMGELVLVIDVQIQSLSGADNRIDNETYPEEALPGMRTLWETRHGVKSNHLYFGKNFRELDRSKDRLVEVEYDSP